MLRSIPFAIMLSGLTLAEARAQEVPAAQVTLAAPMKAPTSHATSGKSVESVQISGAAGPFTLDQIANDQASAQVGHGYDPITGRVLPMVCVVAKDPDFDLENGTITTKTKTLISSEKSYAKSSGSSVGVNAIIHAVQIGVGTSQSHSTSFNSVDSYGRLFNRIATKGKERTTVEWSHDALTLLQKADLSDFLSQCGTRFVRGVYSGQQLDTIVSFVLRQDQKASSSATSVSIGVAKIFGASASFSSAAADANQYSDAYIENNGRGSLGVAIIGATGPSPAAGAQAPTPSSSQPPIPAPPPPTGGTSSSSGATAPVPTDGSGLKTVLDYYENGFAKAVADSGGQGAKDSAVPLYIITDHYQGNLLPMAKKVPIWADGIYDAIGAKEDTYNQLVTAINNLDSAMASGTNIRLGIFYKDDPAYPAVQKLKDAKVKRSSFARAVVACRSLITAGQEFLPGSHSAVDQCSTGLDTALSDDDVMKLTLTRVYP